MVDGNRFKPSQERVTDLESALIVNDALSATLEGCNSIRMSQFTHLTKSIATLARNSRH